MLPEFELIDEIRRQFSAPEGVDVGIGDDAAVFADRFPLVTTDMLVEDVHFRLDWCEPSDVGWKAVTASLSDVAAMGGLPGPYVASIALGADHGADVARGIVRGFRERHAALEDEGYSSLPVGGDLSSSPGPLVVSITLFGTLPGDRALLREGAEPGDRVAVVGRPGRSRAGLARLQAGSVEPDDPFRSLVEGYRRPDAQVGAGAEIGRAGVAEALIDLSDGLIQDLGHLCEASDVGARIEYDEIPRDPDLVRWVDSRGGDLRPYLLAGGEDFCLLAAVSEDDREQFENIADAAGWPYGWIGDIVPAESGVEFVDANGESIDLSYSGYRHFSDA